MFFCFDLLSLRLRFWHQKLIFFLTKCSLSLIARACPPFTHCLYTYGHRPLVHKCKKVSSASLFLTFVNLCKKFHNVVQFCRKYFVSNCKFFFLIRTKLWIRLNLILFFFYFRLFISSAIFPGIANDEYNFFFIVCGRN